MDQGWLERKSITTTKWIGTPVSLVVHTILFIISFSLVFVGISFDKILLIVTTIVSLEAIYLAIFIQMTVNRQEEEIKEVSEDIDEIQEDVEDISEDIDEIQEDVEDISEDIDEIHKKDDELEKSTEEISLELIEKNIHQILKEIDNLKK